MMIQAPETKPTRRTIALTATLVVVLGTAITVALSAAGDPDLGSGTRMSRTPGVSYTISVPTPPPPTVDR